MINILAMSSKTSLISAKIKANLAFQGKTQTQLANALGLTRESLNRRLASRTGWQIDEIMEVAAFLQMPYEALLSNPENFVA